jgi:hypothetical protein
LRQPSVVGSRRRCRLAIEQCKIVLAVEQLPTGFGLVQRHFPMPIEQMSRYPLRAMRQFLSMPAPGHSDCPQRRASQPSRDCD